MKSTEQNWNSYSLLAFYLIVTQLILFLSFLSFSCLFYSFIYFLQDHVDNSILYIFISYIFILYFYIYLYFILLKYSLKDVLFIQENVLKVLFRRIVFHHFVKLRAKKTLYFRPSFFTSSFHHNKARLNLGTAQFY